MKDIGYQNPSSLEKRQVYAVFILLDRYYRMNFNIHEAIPDWWSMREEEWADCSDSEFGGRDCALVQGAFVTRLDALLAFFKKVEPFAYENAERIQIEIDLEQKKQGERIFGSE